MSLNSPKRHAYFLSLTIAGFILLFTVGLASSFFAGERPALYINHLVDSGFLTCWRIALYVILLVFWPRLVALAVGTHQLTTARYKSRKPLLVVVLLYEVLIVFNPLALAISWVI